MSAFHELRRRLSRRIPPFDACLPRPAKSPPTGADWIHEIHDGFRIIGRKNAVGVRLITRSGYDITGRFPLVVAALNVLSAQSCIIDGEAIICDDKGPSVFDLIRYRHYDHVASLCAFDLLELNGQDMRDLPLEERKAALKMLLRRPHPGIATISALRCRRLNRVPPRLQARLRGHRVEAAWLTISVRPIGGLDRGQESGGAGCEARGRRRLGHTGQTVAMTARHRFPPPLCDPRSSTEVHQLTSASQSA
jgi:hypothetical protein